MTDTDTDSATDTDTGNAHPVIDDPAKTLELLKKKSRELKSKSAQLRDQEKELERLRQIEEQAKSELERVVDKARAEARAEAEAEFRQQILRERVIGRAARVLQDPEDAAALIDLGGLDPDDVDGIDAALSSLVESKPYLAGAAATKQVEQGARGDGPAVGATDSDDPNAWLRSIAQR